MLKKLPMKTAMIQSNKGGAKTPEGKAIVSQNATKHGLLSKQVLLPTENVRIFRRFRKEMTQELCPETPLESVLCDRVIADIWRSRRALGIERDYVLLTKTRAEMDMQKRKAEGRLIRNGEHGARLAGNTAPLTDDASARIRRYLSTIDRSILRSLHELQRLQASRKGENVPVPAVLDVNMDNAGSDGE